MKQELPPIPDIPDEVITSIIASRRFFTPAVESIAESMPGDNCRLVNMRRVRDHLSELVVERFMEDEVGRFGPSQTDPRHLQYLNMTANFPQPGRDNVQDDF